MEQAIITNDASASKWKPAGTSGRVVYSSEKSKEEKEPTLEEKLEKKIICTKFFNEELSLEKQLQKIQKWYLTDKELGYSEYMTEIRCSKLFEEINSLYNEIK